MTDPDLSELERLEAKATAGLDLDSLSKLIESPNQHYTGIFPLKGQEWPAVLLGNYYVAFTQRPEEAVRLMRILNAFSALLAHIRRLEREAEEAWGERDDFERRQIAICELFADQNESLSSGHAETMAKTLEKIWGIVNHD